MILEKLMRFLSVEENWFYVNKGLCRVGHGWWAWLILLTTFVYSMGKRSSPNKAHCLQALAFLCPLLFLQSFSQPSHLNDSCLSTNHQDTHQQCQPDVPQTCYNSLPMTKQTVFFNSEQKRHMHDRTPSVYGESNPCPPRNERNHKQSLQEQ